jgi:ABC-2 type transport system ATP-binding protein
MTYGVSGATVDFGSVTALDDVTVEVASGSVVAVVGGDGAGKTTLLRSVVGEQFLTAGHLSAPPAARIGYLPASSGSWGALSVNQNMDFVGGIYGLSGERLRERRTALLESADLLFVADRLASQLSGGMRRKLGFCMAMQHEPDLLVLDEPSTGVDPVSRVELWRLVANAAAGGTAVLMSTTYLDEAERAEQLIVLSRGRILTQGSLALVLGSIHGQVTEVDAPVRRAWAWRRGAQFHEFWPEGAAQQPQGRVVDPDLEDVVITLSLQRRNASAVSS